MKLEVLYERPALPRFTVPSALADTYGTAIGFESPRVYANFVASLDGVAAIPDEKRSSVLISGKDEGDRFIMGLLRACADVVLVGAGTLRTHQKSLWTPSNAFPSAEAAFTELRRARGVTDEPTLAIATASGKIDLGHPGLARGGIIITTGDGAKHLRQTDTDRAIDVVVAGESDQLSGEQILSPLKDRGFELILTEGGPTLFGHLLRDELIGEVFLTMSDRFAGRTDFEQRPGIVQDAMFLPDRVEAAELLSVRRHDSHLFLRYAIRRSGTT